jgi:hypothetical protein
MPVMHESEDWRGLLGKVDLLTQRLEHHEAVQAERHQDNSERIDKLEEAINGNGKPGLKADLGSIMTGIRILKWMVGLGIAIISLWFTHLEISRKISVNVPVSAVQSQQQDAGRQ